MRNGLGERRIVVWHCLLAAAVPVALYYGAMLVWVCARTITVSPNGVYKAYHSPPFARSRVSRLSFLIYETENRHTIEVTNGRDLIWSPDSRYLAVVGSGARPTVAIYKADRMIYKTLRLERYARLRWRGSRSFTVEGRHPATYAIREKVSSGCFSLTGADI